MSSKKLRNWLIVGFASLSLMSTALPAAADDDDEHHHDPFDAALFDPELVLTADIGLTQSQRSSFIDKVVEVQAKVTRMELTMAGKEQELETLLTTDPIDRERLMPLVDELMQVEHDTRRLYLGLMIDMHNALTPNQKAQLEDIRDDGDGFD